MTQPRPRRVAVTGPRTTAAKRQVGQLRRRALDEQDLVGDQLVRTLMRAQLLLALRTAASILGTLGVLPLLFAFVPATRTTQVLGLPLPWLLLGVLVYPGFVLAGWAYVKAAERNERDFVELVGEG